MTTAAQASPIDRWPAYGAAAYLFAIAVMPGAVAPGLVGSAASTLGLTESRLGILIGLYFAGFGVTGASAYLWIRKVNWRVVCAIGIALMGATFLALGSTRSYAVILGLMFLNGVGAGLYASPSITILGDMTRPERGFSTMIIFSVTGAALLLAVFPVIDAAAGFAGVNRLMAVSTLACLLLLPWIPRGNPPGQRPVQPPPNAAAHKVLLVSQPLLAHGVMVLFSIGFIGTWAFFERVAVFAKLAPEATSRALAIGTLVGTLGAPLAAYARRRIPMHYCYAIIIAGSVGTLYLLDLLDLTDRSYLLLTCSFQFWVNAGFCIIMALTAEVDKVGRFVAMIPASEALGSALGPVVTGFALELSGVPTMIAVAAAAFVGGAVILAYVDRKELAVFGPGSPGSKGSPGTAKS